MDDSSLHTVADAHLAAYRGELLPPPERASANWKAITGRLPIQPVTDPWSEAVSAVGPATGMGSLKVFVLTVVLGTGGLVGIDAALEQRAGPAPLATRETPAPPRSTPIVVPNAPIVEVPDRRQSGDAAAKADAPAAPRTPPAPTAAAGSTRIGGVDAELSLMRRIRDAVEDGRDPQALRLLEQHARDFGEGVFRPEREGLHALVLCRSGSRRSGRVAAGAFVARHPSSPLVTRIRRACEDLPGEKNVTDPSRNEE